ncbi:DUF397 domain-containing protein [Nocardiopsis changdeensis]|uniref:DUF397 domain-containing protein n=1 Tax=Nocardiopsis changdeensis TaxID=2831969 RepID=A0ABX8BF28_9ACTN|nr:MULTISPECIES: DUF397 domain-containing protein [Nocardiopsis]QUX20852.1 DUF397 domain-containing protein [Nocardiopsis changdeensis]QYX36784.1 DUF397 domain-containing protein [Nocardiopsis sp. MT53]
MYSSTDQLVFRKSSYSSGQGQDCVEVADVPDGDAAVRDSQNPDAGYFLLTGREWGALLGVVRRG